MLVVPRLLVGCLHVRIRMVRLVPSRSPHSSDTISPRRIAVAVANRVMWIIGIVTWRGFSAR
jgi:hypothetical protein